MVLSNSSISPSSSHESTCSIELTQVLLLSFIALIPNNSANGSYQMSVKEVLMTWLESLASEDISQLLTLMEW